MSVISSHLLLVQYGTISEVDLFDSPLESPPKRDDFIVVETNRGLQLGTVLSVVRNSEKKPSFSAIRIATNDDNQCHRNNRALCEKEYSNWTQRISDWNLNLELIDIEWTLDQSKIILYVLSDRGPDCTKLALQAAAAGLGVIEVQPVSSEGLVSIAPSGGGCGCSSGGGCSSKK